MTLLKWPQELDADALFARVCRPVRARLAEARDAARDAESPREALERAVARGLCPEDWLDSRAAGGRAFGGKPHSPKRIPASIETVTALVADVDGVLAAEELAREFVRRARGLAAVARPELPVFWRDRGGQKLRQRGVLPVGRGLFPAELSVFHDVQFDFRVVDEMLVAIDPPEKSPQRSGLRGLFDSVREALRPVNPYQRRTKHCTQWNELSYRAMRDHGMACQQAIDHHRRAWFCAVLASRGGTIRDLARDRILANGVSDQLAALDLATLPNVFEPLAKLWSTGYAPFAINAERIELQLPSSEDDASRP
ncbi:MAG: hypothetical protein JNK05_24415 [Myxococcales bacterium]|nr:hypothetical protein [Myxococcales bacterium]